MFKIYTKHTREVDETIFEHLRFTLKIAYIMSISSFLFIIHGFTGGLFEMPEKFNICSIADKLCEAKDDRLEKQKEVNDSK